MQQEPYNIYEFKSNASFSVLCTDLKCKRQKEWVNLGGQNDEQWKDVDKLRSDIGSEKLKTWNEIM